MKVRTGMKSGSNGLGDTVADLAHLTGMDQLAKTYEQVTGNSCGCKDRQAKLNQLLPYTSSQTG